MFMGPITDRPPGPTGLGRAQDQWTLWSARCSFSGGRSSEGAKARPGTSNRSTIGGVGGEMTIESNLQLP